MDRDTLKIQLRELIAHECDLEMDMSEISDDEPLIGESSRLYLDSLDALAISLEVKKRFGKHIDSGNETRKALTNINALADFILDN
jgi:acyl carrier protein